MKLPVELNGADLSRKLFIMPVFYNILAGGLSGLFHHGKYFGRLLRCLGSILPGRLPTRFYAIALSNAILSELLSTLAWRPIASQSCKLCLKLSCLGRQPT